jgi:hypothetical protein
MKIAEILSEKIEEIQISLSDTEKRKKVLIFFLGILIFLIFILILMLCYSPKNENQFSLQEYELSEYFYSPSSPEISDGYIYSRNPQKKWTEEEADKYMTLPTEEMLENLKESNDIIIKDILEASP